MKDDCIKLIDKLSETHSLDVFEYDILINNISPELSEYAAKTAVRERKKIYSNEVYIRGLIEITNFCKNNCYYCGIRKSNLNCQRYFLSQEKIFDCCQEGFDLGFRTFVLQGGEFAFYSDKLLCELIYRIKSAFSECAVTLSLGERSKDSYKFLFDAGADRYLLRHETANRQHYEMLHPDGMQFNNRIRCLNDLKDIGYQVGCGFMVGSPYQTTTFLAEDLKFVETFSPDMCGIGPFIPHKDTPLGTYKAGSLEVTCFLLSLLRLIKPNLLLPATTALGTIHPYGREKGIQSGANVVMPNLSPQSARSKYTLYNNKISDGSESAQCIQELSERMTKIGYKIVTSRGDIIKN